VPRPRAKEAAAARPGSVGLRVVRDLEAGLALDELSQRVAASAPGPAPDAGSLDLSIAAHRRRLLAWLRRWGARGFSAAGEATTLAALRAWGTTWQQQLPGSDRALTSLDDDELDTVAAAYAALADAAASVRRSPTGTVAVRFGPTAASKAMFALRPLACPPWDEPIRHALGLGATDTAYRAYLGLVARALQRAAARARVRVDELPRRAGRPDLTPPKLVDEYLWVTISRDGRG
jgi:hypothetical protein